MTDELKAASRAAFRPAVAPSDADNDPVRAWYNATTNKRPRLIARRLDAADVITAVNFGPDEGPLIAIGGGGHNRPGLGICDDRLVIDLPMMKSVRPDPRTALCGAFATR